MARPWGGGGRSGPRAADAQRDATHDALLDEGGRTRVRPGTLPGGLAVAHGGQSHAAA